MLFLLLFAFNLAAALPRGRTAFPFWCQSFWSPLPCRLSPYGLRAGWSSPWPLRHSLSFLWVLAPTGLSQGRMLCLSRCRERRQRLERKYPPRASSRLARRN